MGKEEGSFLIPPKEPKNFFYKVKFRTPFGEEGEVEVLTKEDTKKAAFEEAGKKHNIWEHEQKEMSAEKTGETN